MLSKTAQDFILHVTNWFHGHWEDPEWGRHPATQIVIGLTLRDLATTLEDTELRAQIQAAADKIVAKNSQVLIKQ
ncbi:MAG: hypothetical protein LBU45_00025 [Azoarcus sp.]|nr:hypothetical protein [Azoarcus sp.]